MHQRSITADPVEGIRVKAAQHERGMEQCIEASPVRSTNPKGAAYHVIGLSIPEVEARSVCPILSSQMTNAERL